MMFLSACGEKDFLIGTWKEPVSGITMSFSEDSKVELSLKDTTYTLTYEKKDPNILIIHVSEDGTVPDQQMTYEATEDELIITVDNTKTIFQRVK